MRIITGKAKGLRLKSPKGLETRPTSDRVKESLFSILSGIKNFHEVGTVLDIFAGTGSLGLESISRGARSAVFIDSATTNFIGENIRLAKFETQCEILRGDFVKCMKKLSREGRRFDLIFTDPPYRKGFSQISVELIGNLNLLNDDGILVVEYGSGEVIGAEKFFQSVRKISYGHTTEIEIFVENNEGSI